MPFFQRIVRIVMCVIGVTLATAVHGYDQQLTSTLYATGYSIRAANGTIIDRRNIMEELYLGAWHILPGTGDPYYKGPRLSVEIDLRVGGDYAMNNSEMSPDRLDRFVPGMNAMYMEAVFAKVSLTGLAKDHLDVSAGRIIRYDSIGYSAIDGVELSMHWPFGLRIGPYWGYEVQGVKPFGYDNLSLDGVDDAGRDELDDAWFDTLVDAEAVMKFGTEVALVPSSAFEVAVAFQQGGYGDKLQQQTIAGRLAVGNERVRAFGRVVANPFLDRYDNVAGALREGTLVSEATGELTVATGKKGWMSVAYELYRPIFMFDSIFNVFGQLGRRDLVGRYEYRFNSKTQWAAWSNIRFLDNKNTPKVAEQDSLVIGGGGGAGMNWGTFMRQMSLRLTAESELGAFRCGIEQELGHRFFNERLWMSVRGSLWYIRDTLYDRKKTIGGYVFSANHQFTPKTRAIFEFENYYGAEIPRFVVTALLQLDIWR